MNTEELDNKIHQLKLKLDKLNKLSAISEGDIDLIKEMFLKYKNIKEQRGADAALKFLKDQKNELRKSNK